MQDCFPFDVHTGAGGRLQVVVRVWGTGVSGGPGSVCGCEWSGGNPVGGDFCTLIPMLKLELHPVGGGNKPAIQGLNVSSVTRSVLEGSLYQTGG